MSSSNDQLAVPVEIARHPGEADFGEADEAASDEAESTQETMAGAAVRQDHFATVGGIKDNADESSSLSPDRGYDRDTAEDSFDPEKR